MTPEELESRRGLLRSRMALFRALGHDPQSVPGFVLGGTGALEGPVDDARVDDEDPVDVVDDAEQRARDLRLAAVREGDADDHLTGAGAAGS